MHMGLLSSMIVSAVDIFAAFCWLLLLMLLLLCLSPPLGWELLLCLFFCCLVIGLGCGGCRYKTGSAIRVVGVDLLLLPLLLLLLPQSALLLHGHTFLLVAWNGDTSLRVVPDFHTGFIGLDAVGMGEMRGEVG